jgi:hypothetical protein
MEEEKEQSLTSVKEMKEEEHSDQMLTQWDMELRMLEDWLCHPGTKEDFHKETIM